MKKKIEKFT